MKTFEDYIKPLQDIVYRLCLAYTGHAQDAEDLRQESLYRAYKAFHLFENQSSFDTWMYRITVNCCLSWIKRQKKNTLIAEDVATAVELQLDQAATDDEQPAEIDALLVCIHQLNEVNRLYRRFNIGRIQTAGNSSGFRYESQRHKCAFSSN